MSSIALKNPAMFAQRLVDACLEQGFQSLSKRDLELLLYALLEVDGAISRSASNYAVGRLLRLTPRRVKALRRDAYARWRPLIGDDRSETLRRILADLLTPANMEAGSKYASEKTKADGFLALRVEHADDKEELEQAIVEAKGIPVYERNRDVLVVRFDTLLTMAEKLGFIGSDPKKVRTALKGLAPRAENLEKFFKTSISDLTWEDARAAFNDAGIGVVKGVVDVKLTDLLKVAFPFLK